MTVYYKFTSEGKISSGYCRRHDYPVGFFLNCKLCMEEYDKWYEESGNHDKDIIDDEIEFDQYIRCMKEYKS